MRVQVKYTFQDFFFQMHIFFLFFFFINSVHKANIDLRIKLLK